MNPGIAEQASANLRQHVIDPLSSRCIDREYGGFLVDFDERWRPTGRHEKTLEHASRTTLAFALIERALPGEGCDRLVRQGCAFLENAMWDASHGGFFAKVDRAGRPLLQGLKHPHAVTYVVQTFLAAAPLLAPGEGMTWAQRALAWLDDIAWDPAYGGYWRTFRRDNRPYPDGAILPTPDGRDPLGSSPGFKEVNTLGDAIEMLSACVLQELGTECVTRLEQLVDLVTARLIEPNGALPYLYRQDWRTVPDVVRVGLQFQMIHRLLDDVATGNRSRIVRKSCELADFCLRSARHPSGGFCFAVSGDGRTWPSTGPSTDLRQWWVQLEAIRALHALASHEGVDDCDRTRYRSSRDMQWAFVRDRMLDQRFGGIRELPSEPAVGLKGRLRRLLSPRSTLPEKSPKTHGWKDPFHEVGTFLALGACEPGVLPHQAQRKRPWARASAR